MGKKYDRDEEYLERLEKEVRRLKATNKQLTRRLRKIDRQFRISLELEEEAQRKIPKREKQKPDCPSCKDGYLQDVTFLDKKFKKCTCGYRSKTEKNE